MAEVNHWGVPRVYSELLMLGFTNVSEATVSRYLRKYRSLHPDKKKQQSWMTLLDKVIRYLKKNGGKATRLQIISSRVFNGGVKEYDVVLTFLEKHGKIKTDRNQESKKLWVYSVV
jgi:DNA-binding transcriptional regulator YhcF (GntR family)